MKAVTFDLWNTLISDKDYTGQRVKCLADALREMGISKSYDEIREAYISSHKYVHEICRGENYRYVSADERLNYILAGLSAELTKGLKRRVLEEFEEFVIADPPLLIKGVKETLESLSQKYKMGIICDTGITPGRVLRRVLAERQILRLFDATVFSDEVGYNKPHKAVFETALRKLKAKPAEAIHVGDLLDTDIAGARAVGMKTIWFNKKGTVKSEPHKPDYAIKTFAGLLGILCGIF